MIYPSSPLMPRNGFSPLEWCAVFWHCYLRGNHRTVPLDVYGSLVHTKCLRCGLEQIR